MVTTEDYEKYFGKTPPSDFSRLEFLSLNTFKSIPIKFLPTKQCLIYNDFKKALLEQINFFDLNEDLITNSSSDGYTLGSFSESASNKENINEILKRVSPMAYDILISCGIISSILGGC